MNINLVLKHQFCERCANKLSAFGMKTRVHASCTRVKKYVGWCEEVVFVTDIEMWCRGLLPTVCTLPSALLPEPVTNRVTSRLAPVINTARAERPGFRSRLGHAGFFLLCMFTRLAALLSYSLSCWLRVFPPPPINFLLQSTPAKGSYRVSTRKGRNETLRFLGMFRSKAVEQALKDTLESE